MMQKFLYLTTLIACLGLSSCGSDEKKSEDSDGTSASQDYTQWVANAMSSADHMAMAFSANLGEMVELSHVREGELMSSFGEFLRFLEPEETGLDMDSKSFAFANLDAEEEEYWGAMLFSVQDSEKLTELLEGEFRMEVEKDGDFHKAYGLGGKQPGMVIWKGGNGALVLSSEQGQLDDLALGLFKEQDASPHVSKFVSMDEHITFMMEMGASSILKDIDNALGAINQQAFMDMKGAYVWGGLEFVNGEVLIKGQVEMNEKMKETNFIASNGVSQAVTSQLGSNPVLLMGGHANVQKAFAALERSTDPEDLERQKEEWEKLGITEELLEQVFTGEMAAGVYGPESADPDSYRPFDFRFTLAVGIKDKAGFKELMEKSNAHNVEMWDEKKYQETSYGYKSMEGEEYIKVEDNVVTLCNSEDFLLADKSGDLGVGGKLLEAYPMAMYVDVAGLDAQTLDLMDLGMVSAYFESMVLHVSGDMDYEFHLKMKNKEQNVLETMIEFLMHMQQGDREYSEQETKAI